MKSGSNVSVRAAALFPGYGLFCLISQLIEFALPVIKPYQKNGSQERQAEREDGVQNNSYASKQGCPL